MESRSPLLFALPTPGPFAVDELTQRVAQRAVISEAQAELALAALPAYLTARLPSPVVARIREQLAALPWRDATRPHRDQRSID